MESSDGAREWSGDTSQPVLARICLLPHPRNTQVWLRVRRDGGEEYRPAIHVVEGRVFASFVMLRANNYICTFE